jgi:hypothetical protein
VSESMMVREGDDDGRWRKRKEIRKKGKQDWITTDFDTPYGMI